MVLTKGEIVHATLARAMQSIRHHEIDDSGFEHAMPPLERRVSRLSPDLRDSRHRDQLVIEKLRKDSLSSDSIDFTVSDEIYFGEGVQHLDLARLRKLAAEGALTRIKPDSRGLVVQDPNLEGKNVYYIVSEEQLQVPSDLEIHVDAKSTSGRCGCMCTHATEQIFPFGYKSPVIITAQPYAFPLEIEPGKTRLAQAFLRFRTTDYMTRAEILADNENIQLTLGKDKRKRISLAEPGRVTRYGIELTHATAEFLQAKPACEVPGPLNLDAVGLYEDEDYFLQVGSPNGLTMKPRTFYLGRTQEWVMLGNVCGILSRENPKTGTGTWGHFAGLVHFGWGGPLTTECYSFSLKPIHNGDPVAYMRCDKMNASLSELGKCPGSYTDFNPLTSRMFKHAT